MVNPSTFYNVREGGGPPRRPIAAGRVLENTVAHQIVDIELYEYAMEQLELQFLHQPAA
jgi:hypothetical protein